MRTAFDLQHARPWLSTTPAGFASAVNRLKKRHKDGLFLVVVKAAASGDWNTFNAAMEQATKMPGVGSIVAGRSRFALAVLYGQTGLPSKLYPLFAAVVTLSWSICTEIHGVRPGRTMRTVILNKVLARAEIQALDLPESVQAALYA